MVGFAQTDYVLQERTNPYQLSVQVLSPPQSIIENTGITLSATDGTAISRFYIMDYYSFFVNSTGDSDYSVVTGPLSLLTLSSTNQQTTTDVTIISDGIVLEEEETFSLQLQQTSGQQPVIALRNTTITIQDGDGEYCSTCIQSSSLP